MTAHAEPKPSDGNGKQHENEVERIRIEQQRVRNNEFVIFLAVKPGQDLCHEPLLRQRFPGPA